MARTKEDVLAERAEVLRNTDWTQLPDAQLSEAKVNEYKVWRQQLRDIPANHTDENAYDLLLARNSDGELTNSIWTQPTS